MMKPLTDDELIAIEAGDLKDVDCRILVKRLLATVRAMKTKLDRQTKTEEREAEAMEALKKAHQRSKDTTNTPRDWWRSPDMWWTIDTTGTGKHHDWTA